MNVYQQYLDQNNITRYHVSKISGVSTNTLQHAVDSKAGINDISERILKAYW